MRSTRTAGKDQDFAESPSNLSTEPAGGWLQIVLGSPFFSGPQYLSSEY
jgi:hypothetical protein